MAFPVLRDPGSSSEEPPLNAEVVGRVSIAEIPGAGLELADEGSLHQS